MIATSLARCRDQAKNAEIRRTQIFGRARRMQRGAQVVSMRARGKGAVLEQPRGLDRELRPRHTAILARLILRRMARRREDLIRADENSLRLSLEGQLSSFRLPLDASNGIRRSSA